MGRDPGALTDLIGRRMTEAGATQNRVLEYLEHQHDVKFDVKRLRRLVESLSAGPAEHRQAAQVEELLRARGNTPHETPKTTAAAVSFD